MKKILAILALAFSGASFAATTATVSYQQIDNAGATKDQQQFGLAVKQDLNKTWAADVNFTNTQTDTTNALSTRLEGALTATAPVGPVKGYVRTAFGQKFNNTTSIGYYSVEPGITAPVGPFSAKLGYRYRSAFNSANGDQTHTVRAGLSYALSKTDTVGVNFDRVRGDNTQNNYTLNYTRSF